MEWWDAWTPLWRLTVWKSLFPSLLDFLCPGQQSETRLGSSGVKQEAGVSRAIPALGTGVSGLSRPRARRPRRG